MRRKIYFNPYSTKNALFVSLVVVLFHYVLIMTTTYISFHNRVDAISQWSIISDIIISYLSSVALLFILLKFSFWFAQKNVNIVKKYFFILGGLIILTIPLSLFFSFILDHLLYNRHMYLENIVYKKLMQDFVYAFIAFLITVSIYTIMYNQKVEAENIRIRYEALKNQLDPHFLFNSLNALDGLIGYDDNKAHSYLQKLSQTFRYTIQNKEVTELNEEIKLVDAYCFLMKIRYGDNLVLNINIDDRYRSYLILPVSLQLLIENAIKHNAINDKYPLLIEMETTEENSVKVTNNRNPKLNEEAGSRIGLSNLAERFLLIFNKEIKVESKDDLFSVELPLTEQVQDSEIMES